MADKMPFGERASINRPPLFCGDNYQFWKVRMKIFMHSTDKGIWETIENGPFISYLLDNRNITNDEVPCSRIGRGPTRLKTICTKINKGQKIPFPINVNIGVATRLNSKNFSSYLGVVARERISILTDSWDNVTEHKRNMIWKNIMVCNCFYFVRYELCLYFVQSEISLYFVQFEVYYELIIPNVVCRWFTISQMWKH